MQDLTEDEIEEMMREADLDGDGKVFIISIIIGVESIVGKSFNESILG